MALTAAISISQGTDCTQFSITDTSNYGGLDSKSNISSRTLVIYKSDGTVWRATGQTTDVIDFSFASYPSDVITLEGLDKDYAFSILMTLVPVSSQPGSVYTVTETPALVCNTRVSFFERNYKMSVNQAYENNINYITDTWKIYMNKVVATDSAAEGDIETAQINLDTAKLIEERNPQPY